LDVNVFGIFDGSSASAGVFHRIGSSYETVQLIDSTRYLGASSEPYHPVDRSSAGANYTGADQSTVGMLFAALATGGRVNVSSAVRGLPLSAFHARAVPLHDLAAAVADAYGLRMTSGDDRTSTLGLPAPPSPSSDIRNLPELLRASMPAYLLRAIRTDVIDSAAAVTNVCISAGSDLVHRSYSVHDAGPAPGVRETANQLDADLYYRQALSPSPPYDFSTMCAAEAGTLPGGVFDSRIAAAKDLRTYAEPRINGSATGTVSLQSCPVIVQDDVASIAMCDLLRDVTYTIPEPQPLVYTDFDKLVVKGHVGQDKQESLMRFSLALYPPGNDPSVSIPVANALGIADPQLSPSTH